MNLKNHFDDKNAEGIIAIIKRASNTIVIPRKKGRVKIQDISVTKLENIAQTIYKKKKKKVQNVFCF